jgi:hypothetical protein
VLVDLSRRAQEGRHKILASAKMQGAVSASLWVDPGIRTIESGRSGWPRLSELAATSRSRVMRFVASRFEPAVFDSPKCFQRVQSQRPDMRGYGNARKNQMSVNATYTFKLVRTWARSLAGSWGVSVTFCWGVVLFSSRYAALRGPG